jgi:exosortase K
MKVSIIRQNHLNGDRTIKLIVLLVCLASGKYLLRFVSADVLYFLLWPTSFLVRLFTGIEFEWLPGVGFCSDQGIVIESSCSGAGFFLLTVALGVFHLLDLPVSRAVRYVPACVMLGFAATVVFNSFRIISSMYVLDQTLVSASMLHKSIGIVTFLIGLLLYNYLLSRITRKSGLL